MTKEEQKEQIKILNAAKERMMKEFDFIKVCRYMNKRHWEWHGSNGVPRIYEVETCAKGLLDDVVLLLQRHDFQNDEYFAGTGGFCAFITWYEVKKSLRLVFGKSESKPLLSKTIAIYRRKHKKGFIL